MADSVHLVKLALGDFYDEGHKRIEDVKYMSNYDAGTIWNAYKESCERTGLYFNDNGLSDSEGWRQIFVNRDEHDLNKKAADILREHGIEPEDYADYSESEDDGDEKLVFMQDCSTDNAAALIMAFIGLSMPDDWTYTLVEDNFELINKIQMGYGLFE